MRRTIRLGVVVVAVIATASLGTVLGVPSPAPPAEAQRPCVESTVPDRSGTNVATGCVQDQTGNGGGSSGSGGSGSLDPAAVCRESYPSWAGCAELVSANGIHPDQMCGLVRSPVPGRIAAAQPYYACPRDGWFGTPALFGLTVLPPPPPPPTPEEVAADVLVRVSERLLRPDLATSPAPGTAAIVDVPTFVAVDNWQGALEEEDCERGVCVTLTATPTLRFDPGEPGASVIECDPPGTRFDPDGESPEDQAAAEGACAHTYSRRTGVGSRPDEWTGVVSVEWEVSWVSGATSGSFDPVVLSADVPRPVDEVTGVVTDMQVGRG